MEFRQRIDRLIAKVLGRVPQAGRAWAKFARVEEPTDVPWTPFLKPLQECRVCLITTGGLHSREDRPFDMKNAQGDPTYRRIPRDARAADLTITHNYYDHRDADRDFNILLPLDRLRELERMGFVGNAAPTHYSFMGHIDGPLLLDLKKKVIPQLLSDLFQERPDLAFLTPA